MKRIAYASAIAVVLSLSAAACDDTSTETGGTGGTTSSGTGGTTSSGTGGTTSSGTGGAGGVVSSTMFHCDAETYAQDAMDNGFTFGTVTLTESTPIDDILADTASYLDQVVRIEGFVIEVCTSAGCYVSLEGASGDFINLKVDDGTFDFRDYTETGSYAIGEGVFSAVGEHGAQVYIQDHGGIISAMVCTE